MTATPPSGGASQDRSLQSREDFYDQEIAPALHALGLRCKERGLSFLAVVEWAPGEFGRTLNLTPPSGLGIRLADIAAQANGNVDSLIFAIMKHAREHGHSSACLSVLGVPHSSGEAGPSPNKR